VIAADRNRHASDSNRERIATERPEVQRFNRHALIETEVPKPTCFTRIEGVPVDRRDSRLPSDLQLVEGKEELTG